MGKIKNKKRILLLINNFFPPIIWVSGVKSLYFLSEKLAQNKDYEIHVLSNYLWEQNFEKASNSIQDKKTKTFINEMKKKKIFVHYYRNFFLEKYPKVFFIFYRILIIKKIIALNKKYNFDVINDFFSNPILTLRGKFLIYILKINYFATFLTLTKSYKKQFFILKIFSLKNIKVIATNNYMYKVLSKNIFFNNHNVHNVSVGFNPKEKHVGVKRINKINTKKNIVFLGPLRKIKGYKLFLELAKSFNNSESYNFFLITHELSSKDNHFQKLKGIERTMSNQKNFFLKNGHFNLNDIFKLTDLLVLPQTTFDGATGHPVTLLEFLNNGTPILASNLDGINDIINNTNGYLFEVNSIKDLITKFRLINNKKFQKSLIKNSVKKYSINNIALEYKKIYEK